MLPRRDALSSVLLVLAVSSSFAPSARAEQPHRDEVLRQLFKQVDAAVAASRLTEARAALLAVWNLEQSRKTACNIGQIALRLGDMPEAAKFLTICAERAAESPAGDAELDAARLHDLTEARKHVATIAIDVDTPGAAVFVDGEPVGQAPLNTNVFVEPGPHILRAEIGARRAEKTITAGKGEVAAVSLALTPPPPSPPSPPPPSSPSAQLPLAPRATADARPARAAPPDRPDPGGAPPWVFISGGLLVAGAGGLGIALWVMSDSAAVTRDELVGQVRTQSKGSKCAPVEPDLRCEQIARSNAATLRNVANVSLAGAGVIAAAMVVYYAATASGAEPVKIPAVTSQGLVTVGTW